MWFGPKPGKRTVQDRLSGVCSQLNSGKVLGDVGQASGEEIR